MMEMIKKNWLWSVKPNYTLVFGHTDWGGSLTLVNIFGTERRKAEVCGSFYYEIEPLNLSNFIMNPIADFKVLGISFFYYRKEAVSVFHCGIYSSYSRQLIHGRGFSK